LIDQASTKITLLWASSHVGILDNETVDDAAKEALNGEIHQTENTGLDGMDKKKEKEQQDK
jgi:hypothetical protein